jgi:hypothetical protein
MKHIILYLFVIVTVLGSCDKGEPQDPGLFVSLKANVATVDPLVMRGAVNGQPEKGITGLSGRYLLRGDSADLSLYILLLPEGDTIVRRRIKPQVGSRVVHLVTLYQHRSGEAPLLVWPDNDQRPPDSLARVQLTTRDEQLPVSMKVRFYRPGAVAATDSCSLQRYAFSTFFHLPYANLEYEILNGETGAVVFARGACPLAYSSHGLGGTSIYEVRKSGRAGFDFITLF